MVKLFRRVSAYIIDLIVLSYVVIFPFKKFLDVKNINDININTVYVFLIVGLLTLLYFAVFEYFFKQTIGKMLMHINVKAKTKVLSFKQCIVRNISKISTIVYILDLFYLMKNKNQRYLEVKSRTVTV